MSPPLLAEIVSALADWPEVVAIAEGGSRAAGNADAASDIDLYVYVSEEIPAERREAWILARSDHAEIDNRVWEPGDEWIERTTGIAVDIMYRPTAWMEDQIARVLDRHQASLGYTTCFWYNIQTSRPLYDRNGWFANLQASASRPYPDELVHAIVQKNYRLLRDVQGAFARQIVKAARRKDIVSVNHRTAAFLASYFDVLFALNRAPHPGEKRLLKLAATLPLTPERLATEVENLLTAGVGCEEDELSEALNELVDQLDRLISIAKLPSVGLRG